MNTVRVIKALVRRKLSDDLLARSEPHGLWVLGFPGPLSFLDSWLIPYGLDPRIAWGIGGFRTQRLFLRKPWVLDPEATRLSVPVGISYSALKSWPLSSSCAAQCFCRKPLSSMLTEAHRRSMLTAAYRQVYHLFRRCAL
ncbi:hypothetical protein F2Q69_00052282 [Brassica cretica]|uniref:Uncharacterized protein n=1 Tax=Brassica cretica TaxID=69181 RepID=A0A8S9MW39_BRACR|nr:hypothetical protein F2Q69_00052282 [Brassica cretica]